MKFWDASAIVPLLVEEPHSATVREILVEDPPMVVWWGTRTECISALMRQVREGGLTSVDERSARHVLHILMQTWIEMLPSDAIRGTAERLLAVHSLRTADALQIAAAIQWCQGLTTDQALVTFDRRLREACYREGFTIFPKAF